MKSEGYGGRAGGGQTRDYSKPVQKECWLHGEIDCQDCTEKGATFGGWDAGGSWHWDDDDQLVTDTPRMTLADLENDEAALDDLASDVDAVERGTLTYDEFLQTWGDEVAEEFIPAHTYEAARSLPVKLPVKPMGTSTTPAAATGRQAASWSDWKPGDKYPVTYYGTTTGKKYKPFWSAALSMEYARSLSAKSRSIGRRRDRQMGYRSCPAGRHWGPVGASGILPYAVKDDGRIYVALGKRSKAVQHGGSWAQFGGAIDKKDGGDFDAAYREINEEVEGLKGLFDEDDIVGEFRWDCPAGCGWHYTMFAVRIHAPNGKLPKLSVKKGASSWETDMLAWVPIDVVTQLELHDGFKRGWDRARKVIEDTEEAIRATELQEAGQ